MEGYLNFGEYAHLKITPQWTIKTKENIDWVWTHNIWSCNNFDIILPPGILNFKYNSNLPINMFFDIRQQKTLNLSAGQPIVNLLPMSEKKVKIHLHQVDESEMKNINSTLFKYTYGLNKQKKNIEFIQKNEKKCPFGFGK
jgi:hypothetical protein